MYENYFSLKNNSLYVTTNTVLAQSKIPAVRPACD